MQVDTTSIVIGELTLELAIIVYIIKLSFQAGQVTFQVKTMWDLIVGDSKLQMVKGGFGKAKSPIRIVKKGYDFIEPFLNKFLPIYLKVRKEHESANEDELERLLFVAFQAQMGNFILENIAVPNDITLGAAIMAIIQACFVKVNLNGEVKDD